MSALFRKITSEHDGDLYWSSWLHSFRTENKLKIQENVCKNHDCCPIKFPKEDGNILKYNHGENAMKVSLIIYADTDSLLVKIDACHSNSENSSTSKMNKHTDSGYSLFTHCLFDATKNKHDYWRGKDCTKNFSRDQYGKNFVIYLKRIQYWW